MADEMAERGPIKSNVPTAVWRKIPIDPELSKKPGEEVRVMPDGRVLRRLTGSRAVREWASREAFVEWWRAINEEATRGVDFTLTLLPPIDDFVRDVEAHAEALGPRLGIVDANLDGTVASLRAVDEALRRVPQEERPVADLVTPLVAYVGEVYRKGSEGRWVKPPPTYTLWGREHHTKSTNEPFILAGNGKSFQPFVDVVVPMFEPSKRPSLYDTVDAHLAGAGYSGALVAR